MAGPYRGDARGPCPIGRAADVLGDRWTLLILREATAGITRYNNLQASLGISSVSLQNRLDRMIEDGILVRRPYPPSPHREHYRRYDYRLTPAGEDLLAVLHAMMNWAEIHTTPAEPAGRMRLVHHVCGHDIAPGEPCGVCGRDVARDEIAWIRPWQSDGAKPLASASTD